MNNFSAQHTNIYRLVEAHDGPNFFSVKDYYDPTELYVSGRWELLNYQQNTAVVSLKNVNTKQDFTNTTSISNLISIDVILRGGADMQLDHFNIPNNDMPRILFSSHAANSSQVRVHNKGENYIALGIWIEPEYLVSHLGVDISSFPQITKELLECQYNRSILLPITSAISQTSEEILEASVNSRLDKLFIEAKITELFYYLMQCLQSPESAFNLNNHLSTRKSKAMKYVLAQLNENTLEMPCAKKLAKTVNLSESVLSRTFKSSYGLNMSEYRRQKKLMRAFELIIEGKLSIFQVALEVGYKNQSSFGRAFKSFFGFSPTHLR